MFTGMEYWNGVLQLLAISVLHMSRHFILGIKLAQIDIRWETDNKHHETPPRTKYRSHTWSPSGADGPRRLQPFRNCLCHSTCIWRTAWTLPVRSKQGEGTSAEASAGGRDDTTPIEELA